MKIVHERLSLSTPHAGSLTHAFRPFLISTLYSSIGHEVVGASHLRVTPHLSAYES